MLKFINPYLFSPSWTDSITIRRLQASDGLCFFRTSEKSPIDFDESRKSAEKIASTKTSACSESSWNFRFGKEIKENDQFLERDPSF